MAKGIKTGGRKKGTPNKATTLGRAVIVELLADYTNSGLMASDFMAIEPKDRLWISERLMQYVLPKMQSATIDLVNAEGRTTIEEKLAELSKD